MKGFWYMLEAVISGIIMLGFLLVVSQVSVSAPPDDLALQAYSSLKALDDRGLLRPYAAAGDWGSINSEAGIFSRNHTIEICRASGCQGGRPPDGLKATGSPSVQSVWAGSYLISGYLSYEPMEIRMYLW
jgi:hypothetical protein